MSYSLRCNDLSFKFYDPGIISYSTILEKFFILRITQDTRKHPVKKIQGKFNVKSGGIHAVSTVPQMVSKDCVR
jgi:hypothetical protein